jgi:hypothetical protein
VVMQVDQGVPQCQQAERDDDQVAERDFSGDCKIKTSSPLLFGGSGRYLVWLVPIIFRPG